MYMDFQFGNDKKMHAIEMQISEIRKVRTSTGNC